MSVPIARQIAALASELPHSDRRLRSAVASGRMRPAECDYTRDSLEAALATLIWVRDNEATIKRVHAALAAGDDGEHGHG
jgi:hypothetical protein